MRSNQIISSLYKKGYRLSDSTHPFSTSVQDYLSRHDVVFSSPQKDGFEGLPLGNGDLSAMVWTTARDIVIQLNKSDLWTQPDEEAPMLLRSVGQVRIAFDLPCFEWLYLKKFEARLSLGHERVTVLSETPFSSIRAEIWIDPDQNILMAEIDAQNEKGEPLPFRTLMERYGSRAFISWYHNIRRDAQIGLGSPVTSSDPQGVTLTEPFEEKDHIALSVRMKLSECAYQTAHARRSVQISGSGHAALKIAVAVRDDADDAEAEALQIMEASSRTPEEYKQRRDSWWKEYWDRSFLTLSPDASDHDLDYLENLYDVQVYALGCGSRGKYPMTFNGGTFTWNHDVRQWGNSVHWNTQQSYWAVEAMNRGEEMEPYLRTYTRMIPAAKKFARESHHVEHGMLIAEAHDFSGRMVAFLGAITPVMQIAQQFWNHYVYSNNLSYLRETGYPFIRECADFYADYAVWDKNTQKFAIGPAACCECEFGENFWNTSVDLAMVRYILPIAIRASKLLNLDEERRKKWQYLNQHLPDFIYRKENGREVLAVAVDENGKTVDFGAQNNTFCRDTSPLMPCAIIGSRDKGTRLYRAVQNAAETYPRSALAITPISTIWARLGDGDRAMEFLLHAAQQLQHFPQGFYYNIDHWFQYSRYAKQTDQYLTECQRDYIYDESLVYPQILDRDSGEKVDLPMRPFVQCGFESGGILALTLQDMFLQSYEGVIRLGPALPHACNGAFTLKAAGAFLVTGFVRDGKLLPLAFIRSEAGLPCRVEPWFSADDLKICTADGKDVPFEQNAEGDLLFTLEKGETAILWSEALQEADIPSASFPIITNCAVKTYQQARIGSAADY